MPFPYNKSGDYYIKSEEYQLFWGARNGIAVSSIPRIILGRKKWHCRVLHRPHG